MKRHTTITIRIIVSNSIFLVSPVIEVLGTDTKAPAHVIINKTQRNN